MGTETTTAKTINCQCRVFEDRWGEVHITRNACPLHADEPEDVGQAESFVAEGRLQNGR